jgi:uncharacterized iron-regulated protein
VQVEKIKIPQITHLVEKLKMKRVFWNSIRLTLLAGCAFGCAATPQRAYLKDSERHFETGQIISAATGEMVTFEEMIADLTDSRVVYVGESHTNAIHHTLQLDILQALFRDHADLAVGMEMFDVTYQTVLDRWSDGQLSQEAFIEKTHWYANWRYDFDLYKAILAFIRDNRIPLIGLNIPFHVPRKIRTGGIDSLLGCDRQDLPDNIDTTNAAHRAHLENIFNQHRFHGDANFEFFYEAQCTWEDTMASSVARYLGERLMVVLVGNGHIIHRFGIPERAYERTKAPYRSVYLAAVGETVELSFADYIWVTPANAKRAMR